MRYRSESAAWSRSRRSLIAADAPLASKSTARAPRDELHGLPRHLLAANHERSSVPKILADANVRRNYRIAWRSRSDESIPVSPVDRRQLREVRLPGNGEHRGALHEETIEPAGCREYPVPSVALTQHLELVRHASRNEDEGSGLDIRLRAVYPEAIGSLDDDEQLVLAFLHVLRYGASGGHRRETDDERTTGVFGCQLEQNLVSKGADRYAIARMRDHRGERFSERRRRRRARGCLAAIRHCDSSRWRVGNSCMPSE